MAKRANQPARFWALLAALLGIVGFGCSKQSGVAAGPAAPTILSFSAAPGAIVPGGASVLSWRVNGATKLEIDQGIGAVTGTTKSISPASTTTYLLTASNAIGSTTAMATVTVLAGPSAGSGGGTGAGGSSGGTGSGGAGGGAVGGPGPAFPLKASQNGHYLVDQNGKPFRIQGDASWSLISNLTASEIDTYLADRKARGFNTLLVNAIEAKFAVKAPQNRAGDYPFTAHASGSYDFTTPNEAYFAFADAALDKAAAAGMLVLLDVMYAGNGGGNEGWWSELTNATNTRAKCYAYGQFLGNRWKGRANIVWVLSGDFTPPAGSEGEARLLQIYQGIRAAGATQLATDHLRGGTEGPDWSGFAQFLQVNPIYNQDGNALQTAVRSAYNRKPALPAFEVETVYESEGGAAGDPGPIRSYAWWSQLGAIAGAFYGHRDIWEFSTDNWSSGYPFGSQRWQLSLDTPGSNAMRHMATLLATLPWYNLVPSGLSGMKNLVTSGGGSAGSSDFVAAAATTDGKALLAYLPPGGSANRSVTVDMSALSAPATARWWDPTNGASTDIATGLANAGTHVFTVPRANAAGATDWVLVVTP